MYKVGQIVKSKISESVYLILADCGFYYDVRVLVSCRPPAFGIYMHLTKDFDGDIIANNYKIK